jgi:hypothetical protein
MNKKKDLAKVTLTLILFLMIMSKIQIGRKNKHQKNLPLFLLL